MTYVLGIDVGTTFISAAICRRRGASPSPDDVANVESVGLGTRSTAAASVVAVADDGRWLIGDAAERRSHERPDLVVREFKRRIGDPVPLIVAGERHKPEAIAGRVVRWVADAVVEREGAPAAGIVVTHPASWGSYKRSLVSRAIADAGLADVTLLTEPVAAAAHYAAQARVAVGSTVAVYDLGGGTFDAAVVRKVGEQSFELLGTPQGIDRLGGLDFDEAVFRHVCAGVTLPRIDPDDPDAVAAMIRLRRECTEAKEALSADTDATIPILLPDLHTRVRLVRAEFEDLIRDAIEQTVDALGETATSAGVAPDDLDAVLLVGGSSRIPLVTQLVSQRLGRPVVVDADPKAAIALGAAVVAASADLERAPSSPAAPAAPAVAVRRHGRRARRRLEPAATPVPAPVAATVAARPPAPVRRDGAAMPLRPAMAAPTVDVEPARRGRTRALAVAAGVAVIGGSALAVAWPPQSNGSTGSVSDAGTGPATTVVAAVDASAEVPVAAPAPIVDAVSATMGGLTFLATPAGADGILAPMDAAGLALIPSPGGAPADRDAGPAGPTVPRGSGGSPSTSSVSPTRATSSPTTARGPARPSGSSSPATTASASPTTATTVALDPPSATTSAPPPADPPPTGAPSTSPAPPTPATTAPEPSTPSGTQPPATTSSPTTSASAAGTDTAPVSPLAGDQDVAAQTASGPPEAAEVQAAGQT